MQTLFYLFNTDYPNTKAHSIQITKTLFSLKSHFRIICVVNTLTVPQNELFAAVQARYGYDLRGVEFLAVPKKKLRGLRFYLTLKKILSLATGDACFYTRSYTLAKRLVRSRCWHHKRVILEAHKKDGYYKEERVPDSPYRKQRKDLDTHNETVPFLKKLYQRVDGIIFTSAASEQIVRTDLTVHNTTHIWHALNKKYSDIPASRPDSFVYCGSITRDKLMDLLLDALALTSSEISIAIYGGTEEDRRALQKLAEQKKVLKKIDMKGRVSHQNLSAVLQKYRFGIATMEGLKVADYVENGLTPIIPRLGTYTGVFKDDQAIYFSPDSPKSLAKALTQAREDAPQIENISTLVEHYSLANFGNHLASAIRKFTHA
ncbi:MAG: glycosyltransferase [Desulfoplanes sp.]|nr:glycosyltransferase [Desulfoplanes sp.]MDD4649489.1 glycosyltransferase [Desulfoplanes sp.]